MKRVVLVCIISLMAGVAWGGVTCNEVETSPGSFHTICVDDLIPVSHKWSDGTWHDYEEPKPESGITIMKIGDKCYGKGSKIVPCPTFKAERQWQGGYEVKADCAVIHNYDGRWSNDSVCFDINTGKKVECGAWPSKPKPKPCRWEHKQVIGDNLIKALNDGWELVDSDFNRELRTVFDAWSGISRYINRPVMVPYGIVRKQVCE